MLENKVKSRQMIIVIERGGDHLNSLTGYIIGGIVIVVALIYSIKEVKKSIKSGGCNCSGCPSAKNKEKK